MKAPIFICDLELTEPISDIQPDPPAISVVVCTRDRPVGVVGTLRGLTALRYERYEIVVVDNAPRSEATKQAVLREFGGDPRVRYVREPRQGLSSARNRGITEAMADIVAFTDDDVRVDPWWLHGIASGFRAAPDVTCPAVLLSWLRLLALDGKLARAEPKTLRYRVLHAARLVRGGRRRTLKIAAAWPWPPRSSPPGSVSRPSRAPLNRANHPGEQGKEPPGPVEPPATRPDSRPLPCHATENPLPEPSNEPLKHRPQQRERSRLTAIMFDNPQARSELPLKDVPGNQAHDSPERGRSSQPDVAVRVDCQGTWRVHCRPQPLPEGLRRLRQCGEIRHLSPAILSAHSRLSPSIHNKSPRRLGMPGVSVVVPTKDRLPYLQRAIPMFLSHSEVEELIIVVDGCSDNTLEYAKAVSAKDSRVRYFDNVQNKGLPYSRNKGIELASCEYVFTGEDDLELTDNFFTILFSHMEANGADILSGRNIFRAEKESKEDAIARSDRKPRPPINKRRITVDVDTNTGSDSFQPLLPAPMLARTEIFRKIPFDVGYTGNFWREESDFQLSASEAGYCLAYCPHATSFNLMIENDHGGVHTSGGLRRVVLIVKNNWRFINKHRDAVSREFGVGNLPIYIARFAAWKFYQELIYPPVITSLVKLKRRVTGQRPV